MDFTPDKPIYRQIIDYSFDQILTGQWPSGQRIPSVRELSMQLTVNSHTVLKAYEFLQSEGIIIPKRGMGFYLTNEAVDHINQARRREFFDITLQNLFKEMKLLGISIDDIVASFQKLTSKETQG